MIEEGNVRRLIIKSPGDDVLLEIPLTAGVAAGALAVTLAPVLTALTALATTFTNIKIEIIRESDDQ